MFCTIVIRRQRKQDSIGVYQRFQGHKEYKEEKPCKGLKDTDRGASTLETNLDKFRQSYVAEIINTSDLDKQLVVIDDIVLQQKHLQCLTMTDVGEDDKWLGDKVRYLPKLVYQFSSAQYN